jgi:hypothetical protein
VVRRPAARIEGRATVRVQPGQAAPAVVEVRSKR